MKTAAQIAGARFYYLKRDILHLNLALIQFALNELESKGYIPLQKMCIRDRLNSIIRAALSYSLNLVNVHTLENKLLKCKYTKFESAAKKKDRQRCV